MYGLTGRTAARTVTRWLFLADSDFGIVRRFAAVVRGGRTILFDGQAGRGGLGEGKFAISMPERLCIHIVSIRLVGLCGALRLARNAQAQQSCRGTVPKTNGILLANLFRPTFLLIISMVMCLQRSHRRGAIFDSAEFANSIRSFSETGEAFPSMSRNITHQAQRRGQNHHPPLMRPRSCEAPLSPRPLRALVRQPSHYGR
jgi:hypothetical protein